VLALIQDERGAEILRPLLPRAVISSVNIAEVLAKLVRDRMPLNEAAAAIAALHIDEVGFDSVDAHQSASYVTKGVSLGDRCFLAATARHGEGFTSDRELLQTVSGAPRLHGFR